MRIRKGDSAEVRKEKPDWRSKLQSFSSAGRFCGRITFISLCLDVSPRLKVVFSFLLDYGICSQGIKFAVAMLSPYSFVFFPLRLLSYL